MGIARHGLPAAIIKKYGVTKKAWAVFRGRHRKAHVTRPKTKQHRSVVHIARRRYGRKHRSGGGGIFQTAERLAKVGAFIGPYVSAYFEGGSPEGKLDIGLWRLTGWSIGGKKWIPSGLIQGWGPLIGVSLGFKAYHKLMGMLRKA